jgi:hypothetical protein
MMKRKFNWREFLTGLVGGLITIPLIVGLLIGVWKAYRIYQDRQRVLTITGPMHLWKSYDWTDKDNGVMAVLDKGDRVEVRSVFSDSSGLTVIEVRWADGREGYIRSGDNYILSE